jgi:outer membrane protein OmpA-like peptidoglycan-associated protein
MNIIKSHLAVASAVAIVLAACSSQPPLNNDLEMARSAVQRVESSPDAGKYAAAEVSAAHDALLEGDELTRKGKSKKDIQQAAYVAKRHADIAAERIAQGQAEAKTAAAEGDRQKVVLQAREQEAAAARSQAELAKGQAELARNQAEMAKGQAEAAKGQAEAARGQAEMAQQQAQIDAEAARRTAADLEAQLRELQAKQTDRGLVLTLGDVLFDSGQASLKPGAASSIDRLTAFLSGSPDRSVIIEGHTDSLGADSFNLSLSENRANAVKAALMAKGISPQRIVTVGKGESVPVASNDNSAGRQQNRRVEIIISNPPAVVQRN